MVLASLSVMKGWVIACCQEVARVIWMVPYWPKSKEPSVFMYMAWVPFYYMSMKYYCPMRSDKQNNASFTQVTKFEVHSKLVKEKYQEDKCKCNFS